MSQRVATNTGIRSIGNNAGRGDDFESFGESLLVMFQLFVMVLRAVVTVHFVVIMLPGVVMTSFGAVMLL